MAPSDLRAGRRDAAARSARAAVVLAGLEQRVLATAEEYLALYRAGALQLFAGSTSDQVHSPESEDAFLRMCAYLIEKGTGQYWLRFVR